MQKNPNLSCTDIYHLEHALRYGFGLKSYLNDTIRPLYSIHGVPHNPVLGHCLFFNVPQKIVNEKAMNVVDLHRDGLLRVDTRILNEGEITFHGGLPRNCYVGQIHLAVPDLNNRVNMALFPAFTQAKVETIRKKLRNNPEGEQRIKLENEIILMAIKSYCNTIHQRVN